MYADPGRTSLETSPASQRFTAWTPQHYRLKNPQEFVRIPFHNRLKTVMLPFENPAFCKG